MSPERTVSLHVPRSVLWLLGLLLIAPWLAFGSWMLFGTHRSPTPGPVSARSAPRAVLPAAPRNGSTATDMLKCKPGPWGELEYLLTLIEPPEEFILADYTDIEPQPWVFKGYSAATLAALWQRAGLGSAQRQSLEHPARVETSASGIVVRPDPDVIIDLSPAARTAIYTALAEFPENFAQFNPYRLRLDAARDWIKDADLPDAAVALTKRMLYQRGVMMCFSDYRIVLATLPTAADRARYIKTLSRKSALIVQLFVPPGADIESLDRYWDRGRRSKDIKPLLQSLARRPHGGAIDIIHLLPPFARALLYTYPLPSERPAQANRDCHWTSLNFLNGVPDDRFASIDYTRQVLLDRYYRVYGEPQLGDVLMLTRTNGVVAHSCVYIADDIVFTKNGPAFSVPWLLSPLDSVVAFYSSNHPLEIRRYRARKG